MRILYILTSLGMGGAERQVTALADRMAAKGHTVAFLVLKHTDSEWPVKLPVLRLNLRKTPIAIGKGLAFAADFVQLFRPDILHSHTFPGNLFARFLKIRRLGPRSPLLINTLHNVYEGQWHRMLLYRLTDPWVQSVTSVSQAVFDRFSKRKVVTAHKLVTLTNGVDTAWFSPVAGLYRSGRQQMQVNSEFIWIAVGRLVVAKDYPNLLGAFARVRALHPDAQLWIAGEGNRSNLQLPDPPRHEYPGVRFLGLRLDILSLLSAADGFVLSSAWEGLPLALAEAMSMQKPVVATDVGGVRELVGSTGLLVPPGDSQALAESMLRVMAMTPLERKMLGRDARSRVEKHFSLSAKAEEWEQFYRKQIGETGQ